MCLVPKSLLVVMVMITRGSIKMLHDAHPRQRGSNKLKGAKIELIANQDIQLHADMWGLTINDAQCAHFFSQR